MDVSNTFKINGPYVYQLVNIGICLYQEKDNIMINSWKSLVHSDEFFSSNCAIHVVSTETFF